MSVQVPLGRTPQKPLRAHMGPCTPSTCAAYVSTILSSSYRIGIYLSAQSPAYLFRHRGRGILSSKNNIAAGCCGIHSKDHQTSSRKLNYFLLQLLIICPSGMWRRVFPRFPAIETNAPGSNNNNVTSGLSCCAKATCRNKIR